MKASDISTVFTDFDGVIRFWNIEPIELVERKHNLASGSLFKTAFKKCLLTPAITGESSHKQWLENVISELAELYDLKIAHELVRAWENCTFSIDTELLKIYRQYFPNAKLVLVTNATDRLVADMASANLSDAFDLVVNSSNVGIAKPDRGFYEAALATANASPNRSVFVDDSKGNVDAALNMGLNPFYFESRELFVSELESCFHLVKENARVAGELLTYRTRRYFY